MKKPVTFFLVLLLAYPLYAAKLYRWVDENGKVHYSDRVPPSQVGHERSQLNEQGVVVKKFGAAKTKEELARELELETRRKEQQRLAEEQKKADRVLLRTFRSEDDVVMARNGKLASIDAKIQIIRGSIRRQKYRMAEQQSNAANLERKGKVVPENLLKQIDNLRSQIGGDYKSLISHEQLKQKIRESAASDLVRFRQLKNLQTTGEMLPEKQDNTYSLLETLVICTQGCNVLWERAEAYVRRHSTTRMQLIGKRIIMTKPPVKDTDVSVTVSRIEKGEGVEEFFLDVQCKDSTPGEILCKSPGVQSVRHGFRKLQENLPKEEMPLPPPAETAG